jgi:opacity protein-like surface antigen
MQRASATGSRQYRLPPEVIMLASSLSRAALLSVAVVTSALAQDSTACQCSSPLSRSPSEFERRSSGGVAFVQSRPTGAFSRNIGFGYGGTGTYLFRLDDAGAFLLRADAGFLGYGYESFRAPLSPTVGGRIEVKVSTTNYLVPLSIGPQLAWPRGVFRPYVNTGVATQIFFTESGIEGSNDSGDFASTTNQSDWTVAWVLGGGLYMPVYERNTLVAIDVGVQYFTGGHAQYLRPGSIQDLPNAQIRVTPMESDTHMLLVRIGVRIGL